MQFLEEKLMKCESFHDYAKCYHWKTLFKPGECYSRFRIVLRVDRNSVTHIGEVSVSGYTSPTCTLSQYSMQNLLRQDIEWIDYGNVYLVRDKWIWRQNPTPALTYELYEYWSRKPLPMVLEDGNLWVTVRSIDFNVRTTTMSEVPEDIMRRKIFCLKDPGLWLTQLGGRFLECQEKYHGERIGLHKSILPRRKGSGLYTYNWWDVPNDAALISRIVASKNFVSLRYVVYLPYVSIPLPCDVYKSTAMGFDCDDFLPNPRKRRVLFCLVKQMSKSLLDSYFSEKDLWQYNWGKSTISLLSDLGEDERSSKTNRWLRVQAITSHQPNSVLGQILVEGEAALVIFVLQYFSINAEILNKLTIGFYPAVEKLARVGRLNLISSLVRGKLKLSGSVLFHPGAAFKRIWSAVFAAIEAGNVEYLKAALALNKSNELTIRDDRGMTALGLAVIKNKVELVRLLLTARAMVDQPSWGDETVLCLALQFEASREVVEELIQAGAQVSGRDMTGQSIKEELKVKEIILE